MKKLHFIGIGGIGMSGLAAMARTMGLSVTGSDRGADRPENRHIFSALKKQGIAIYPQDGSFAQAGLPDAVVYSTAIEDDNPDLAAAAKVPRLHRSALLEKLLANCGKKTIAVTGSCGKSTVCAYMAEAMENLGIAPSCLNGALSKRFRSEIQAGNYHAGSGEYLVFEADESDKSLLNYGADYALILNMGTDHYSKEELARVFGEFLKNIRRGAVLDREVFEAVKAEIPAHLAIAVFDDKQQDGSKYFLQDYRICDHRASAIFQNGNTIRLPQCGKHMALNALAVMAMLEMLGVSSADAERAVCRFDGICRRTDLAGNTSAGTPVYDDYAHNPEKIISCLNTMHDLADGNVFAVFQPHGYGPWGFMHEQLFLYLEKRLKPGDVFILLEPYYAGGTSSFKPTSAEVLENWHSRAEDPSHYLHFSNREAVEDYLHKQVRKDDIIVIMGARDNSLNDWSKDLTQKI